MARNDVVLLDCLVGKARSYLGAEREESEAFELFCFDQILKDYELSYEELESGWTDGPDDGGIDGFLIFVDGNLATEAPADSASRRNPEVRVVLLTVNRSDVFNQQPLNALLGSLPELFDLTKAAGDLQYPFCEEVIAQRELFPKPVHRTGGLVLFCGKLLVWFGVPIVVPEATASGVIGGLVGGLAVVVWWVFFSRAPRSERWGAVALMIIALAATPRILHPSIADGMRGMMFPLYAAPPVLSLALVAWAVASRNLAAGPRRATLVATILAACGFWALLRTDGVTDEGRPQLAWLWSKTSEQQLLARAGG